MQSIWNCYPRTLRYTGATASARAVSAATLAEGAAHVYPHLQALALTNRRREFCWALAQFVNQTLLPLVVEQHPYLYRAVSAILESAGYRLRAGAREEELIRKFYDVANAVRGPEHNQLACLLFDNWSEASYRRQDPPPTTLAADP
jgi:hypothetical protein